MNLNSRKLVLHIGTGKAGSTSIQTALSRLDFSRSGALPIRAFGTKNAIYLAMSVRSANAYSYFVEKHKKLTDKEFENNAQTIWGKALKEMEASGGHCFVASSEFIYSMIRGESIALLKQNLEQLFDQIHIVVYLREQRSYLRSLWAQMVKGPGKSDQSFSQFLSEIDNRRYMWNYSIFLRDWVDVFGEDNLKVTMFDSQTLHGGDVVLDFFQKAGVSFASDNPIKRENTSPSWGELEEIRLSNLARNNPEAARSFSVREQPMDQEQYNALVLEKVSDGNRWVNEKFLKDQPVKLPCN